MAMNESKIIAGAKSMSDLPIEPLTEEKQFANPEAPNYDWQRDREHFNQRLANARIRNSELEQKNAQLRKQLAAALKAAQKKIRCLSTKALNSNLEHFCGDFAEAYRTGVEEAQGEIVKRLQELAK